MGDSSEPSALKTTLLGILFGCTASSLGGMTVALTRLIINETDPMSLASVRYFIGGAVLLLFMMARIGLPKIARADWLPILGLGVIMFACFPFFFARALEDTTSARGAIIFGSIPIGTVVLATLFRVEKLTWLKALGVLVAIAGAVVVLGERVEVVAPNALRGDFFMFLGMMSASTFNVFSRKYLIRYGTMPVNVYAMLMGSSLLFVVALFFAEPLTGSLDFGLTGWFVVLMLAIPGASMMMASWGKALQLITPTQAAVTVGMNPVTAVLIAAWLLSEPISLNVVGGFILIVIAVVLANYRPKASAS